MMKESVRRRDLCQVVGDYSLHSTYEAVCKTSSILIKLGIFQSSLNKGIFYRNQNVVFNSIQSEPENNILGYL